MQLRWCILLIVVEEALPLEIDRVLVFVSCSLVADRLGLDLEVREFVVYEAERLVVFVLEAGRRFPEFQDVLVEVVRRQGHVLLLCELDPLLEVLKPTLDVLVLDELLLAEVLAELQDGRLRCLGTEVEVRVHHTFAHEARVPVDATLLVDVLHAPEEVDLECLVATAIKFVVEGVDYKLDWMISRQELLLLRQGTDLRSIEGSDGGPDGEDDYDREAELVNKLVPWTSEEFVQLALFLLLDGVPLVIAPRPLSVGWSFVLSVA